jgi:hypothetical protein
MNMPGFSAEASVYTSDGCYASAPFAVRSASAVIPAIPACKNCDWILNNCNNNGWRPRAVCDACFYGNCYSGVEVPPWKLQFP